MVTSVNQYSESNPMLHLVVDSRTQLTLKIRLISMRVFPILINIIKIIITVLKTLRLCVRFTNTCDRILSFDSEKPSELPKH